MKTGTGWIEKLMPPLVTGAIVMIIGLNLAPITIKSVSANSFDTWMAVVTILCIVDFEIDPSGQALNVYVLSHPSALGKWGSKNRIVAAILAFFVGGFGIHKFYLGQIGWGIVYLLFCWTFIPALVAFIEFIIYLCTSDEDFARKYG